MSKLHDVPGYVTVDEQYGHKSPILCYEEKRVSCTRISAQEVINLLNERDTLQEAVNEGIKHMVDCDTMNIRLIQERDQLMELVNEVNDEYRKVTGEYWLPTSMDGKAIVHQIQEKPDASKN